MFENATAPPTNGVSKPPPSPPEPTVAKPMFPPVTPGTGHRQFTEEQKKAAVKAAFASPNIRQWAKDNNVSGSKLFTWRKQLGMTPTQVAMFEEGKSSKPSEGPRTRRVWTDQQKATHARLGLLATSRAEYAKANGIHGSLLDSWIRQYGPAQPPPKPAQAPGRNRLQSQGISPRDRGKQLMAVRAKVVAQAKGTPGEVAELSRQYGLPGNTISRWLRVAGVGKFAKTAFDADPTEEPTELDHMSDEEVLSLDAEERALTARGKTLVSNLRDENARLRQMIGVLQANMKLAVDSGLFNLFTDVDRFLAAGKKGK